MANVVLTYVMPTFGCILGNILFLSPLPAVLALRKNKSLGAVNPLPYPLIFTNTAMWILYGLIVRNYFIYFANCFGCMLGAYYTISALSVAFSECSALEQAFSASTVLSVESESADTLPRSSDQQLIDDTKAKRRLRHVQRTMRTTYTVFFIGLALILISQLICFIVLPDAIADAQALRQTNISFLGVIALTVTCVFYMSPLSTLFEVFRTRNAESLDPRLCLTAILNCIFWTIYGWAALNDPVVYAPNIFGAFLSIIQLIALMMFSDKARWCGRAVHPKDDEQVDMTEEARIAIDGKLPV